MLSDQSDPRADYDEYSGVPRDFPSPCTDQDCDNWIDKIQDFRPSYQGGGGGGGGATIIFKLDQAQPSRLVPLIIAGGGGGMADLPSDNNPDSTEMYGETEVNPEGVFSSVEAAALILDNRYYSLSQLLCKNYQNNVENNGNLYYRHLPDMPSFIATNECLPYLVSGTFIIVNRLNCLELRLKLLHIYT